MKNLLYFGCKEAGGAGHFLYDSYLGKITGREHLQKIKANTQLLKYIDGMYTPLTNQQGQYNDCVIPPYRIVAWWDYTGDDRSGSNSNLIGIGYESAEEMIDDAYKIFPSIMNRQPRPTKVNI